MIDFVNTDIIQYSLFTKFFLDVFNIIESKFLLLIIWRGRIIGFNFLSIFIRQHDLNLIICTTYLWWYQLVGLFIKFSINWRWLEHRTVNIHIGSRISIESTILFKYKNLWRWVLRGWTELLIIFIIQSSFIIDPVKWIKFFAFHCYLHISIVYFGLNIYIFTSYA